MDLVSGMDADRVTSHPRPGKWSIQEIVEHLVLSETGVFGDLDALDRRTPRRRRARDYLLYPLVMFILRFDIPVRVPSPSMIPRGELSLRELGGRWRSTTGVSVNGSRPRTLRTWSVRCSCTRLQGR